MKPLKKLTGLLLAVMIFLLSSAGPAQAARAISITWAFLFPVPLPLPVWSVDHPDSFVTIGFLFPVWLPLPFYNYDSRGPVMRGMGGTEGLEMSSDTGVYIDGELAGRVSEFTDDTAFTKLPDGLHKVELIDGKRTIYAATFGVRSGEVVSGDITGAD